MYIKSLITCVSVSILSSLFSPLAIAATSTSEEDPKDNKRVALYQSVSSLTGIPWEYLASLDQYEQNIHQTSKKQANSSTKQPISERVIGIEVPIEKWVGLINPNPDDVEEETIQYFGGIGRDGDGDGKADRHNDIDVLATMASLLTKNGLHEDLIREQIWRYYLQPTAVDVITHIAKIYSTFGTIDLQEKFFPVAIHADYSYRDTWGDRRGWGGLRIHEGTDIFANYGTPVLSTCYGYVELIGWNRFGGWRIGIRDAQNQYHYFAHLNGFKKGLKQGDIVKPGDVIGSVGSTGYGPPGTSGKFPPHLHYGLYRFNGNKTYSFDPYPLLKKWEKETRQQKKAKKSSP